MTVVVDDCMIGFTEKAGEIMSRRAQATLPLLRELTEMGKRRLRSGVKAAVPLPRGGQEHCWFEVVSIGEQSIVGKLAHEAPNLGLREGHQLEVPRQSISDWAISLPFGVTMTPRNIRSRRFLANLRQKLDQSGEG